MTAKERHQDKVMTDLMRNSDEYYRKHPDQPKEILEMNRKSKEARDEWQMKHYGTVTIERSSRLAQYQKIVAVPVEIEVPGELDQLVKLDILETVGMTYSEWIEQCYRERMKQILTNPTEFGNVLLWHIKRNHVFQEDSLD